MMITHNRMKFNMIADKHKFAMLGAGAGIAGACLSTQLGGIALDFHPVLGGWPIPLPEPFGGLAVYQPLDVYRWAVTPGLLPDIKGALMATTALLAASIGSAAYLVREAMRGAFKRTKFGESAWGTYEDAVNAGLIAGKGPARNHEASPFRFVLGEAFGTTLTVTDDRDVGVFLPKRGGKSRLLSRSLFTWKSSAFIFMAGSTNDVWAFSSGYRATFSKVVFLDLGNPDGYRYNPLGEIRKGTDFEWDDCRLIANRLPTQSVKQARIPYWITAPTKVIAAIIQYVVHMSPVSERNMGTVRDLAHSQPAVLAKILATSPHKNVQEMAATLKSRDPEKVLEVLNAAQDYLSPWDSEIIRRVTSESDFHMSDLQAGDIFSLYIRVPDSMTSEWTSVAKIIFAQARKAILHHEDILPDGRTKENDMAFILDEFSSIAGTDPDIQNDFAKLPKYGARIILAAQSPKTLEEEFGANQTITQNLLVQVYGASGDAKTQEEISKSLGEATEVRQSTSSHSDFLNPLPKGRGTVQSEQVRRLLNSGEIRSFSTDEVIIMPTGHKPFRARKMMDFDRREPWKSMVLPPAPVAPDRKQKVLTGVFI